MIKYFFGLADHIWVKYNDDIPILQELKTDAFSEKYFIVSGCKYSGNVYIKDLNSEFTRTSTGKEEVKIKTIEYNGLNIKKLYSKAKDWFEEEIEEKEGD